MGAQAVGIRLLVNEAAEGEIFEQFHLGRAEYIIRFRAASFARAAVNKARKSALETARTLSVRKLANARKNREMAENSQLRPSAGPVSARLRAVSCNVVISRTHSVHLTAPGHQNPPDGDP
jgi:hypothetical protein